MHHVFDSKVYFKVRQWTFVFPLETLQSTLHFGPLKRR